MCGYSRPEICSGCVHVSRALMQAGSVCVVSVVCCIFFLHNFV